ncbi:MAG: TonB-dependent receptor plug domain-containing protein [Acidobacteriota bacterium]
MSIKLTYRLLIATFLFGAALALSQAPPTDLSSSGEKQDQDKERKRVPDKQTNTPTEKVLRRYDELTVTATRTPTKVQEIGQSVTLITADEIAAQGARTLKQVLETVPGFSVAQTGSFGGATSIFVRGGESDFNLVLIDGVRVNQAGGSFDFADLTTANVERIEIVRGPSSVLYGAESVTSTINIITRRGEGKLSGHFSFEGGTFDSRLFRGGIQGESRNIHYSFGALHSTTDGSYDFNNQYDKTELSGQAVFDLTSTSNLSTQIRHIESEYHFPTDSTGAVVDPNDFRETDETTFSVSYHNQWNGWYGSRLRYGYYRRDSSDFTLRDGRVDFFDFTFQTLENRNYIDWQNDFQLGPRNLITAGASYEREETEVDQLDRRSVGLYVQEQFSWNDRFFLTAGARYDQNDRFRNFATGTVSIGYLLSDEWKVRGSFGNGFRAPSFLETAGIPAFGILGNANLKPEKNIAADFGLDYFPAGGKSGLSATVFFNRFSDLIEFSFATPPGTPNYLNVEKAKSQGVELEGFILAADRLRLGSQYTLTSTEVTDAGTVPGGSFAEGERLLRRPRHTAGVYAEFLRNRYKMRIDFKYKGSRDDLQFFPDFSSARVALPPYWKVDFGLTLPLLGLSDSGGDLALVLRGENILDKKYTEVAGFGSVGRSLFAGIQVAF